MGTDIGIPSGPDAKRRAGAVGEAGAVVGEPTIIRRGAQACSPRRLLAADSRGCLLARGCGPATLKS
ncbi:hypothetical protein CUJ89_16890 [Burkholderia pyrrocinia]|uniref:Uncharacterized protein n=1 Tax=Burkholderia pyrrocinia TaxID=60550 RepID=A0A2Z5MXA1_BURPY|nr:hypothetical protein CUJ89_16890 [Burkholderia pyrrocinia]